MIKKLNQRRSIQLEENEGIMGQNLHGFLECANSTALSLMANVPFAILLLQRSMICDEVDHIQLEIKHKSEKKYKLQVAMVELKEEEQQLSEQDKKIVMAEKFLLSNSISSENELVKIEDDLNSKEKYLANLPQQISYVGDDPFKTRNRWHVKDTC